MKRHIISCAILLAPLGVFAASQITFQGEVTNQTCAAAVNGQTDGVIFLPTVSAASLADVGATTGTTPFTIGINGCTAPAVTAHISTKFLGHFVTPAGNLSNTATINPAGNVGVQLLTSSTGGTPVVLNGMTPVEGLVLEAGETSTTHSFGVRYISEAGGATPGAVQAVVEYSLNYN